MGWVGSRSRIRRGSRDESRASPSGILECAAAEQRARDDQMILDVMMIPRVRHGDDPSRIVQERERVVALAAKAPVRRQDDLAAA
jgi:hypothetical protein